MASALLNHDRPGFKRLLEEAPEPVPDKHLFAVIKESDGDRPDIIIVDSKGDDLPPDMMITPEHHTDFLNVSFGRPQE